MPSDFIVTAASASLELRAGEAVASFTVLNQGARRARLQLVLVPSSAAASEWLALEGLSSMALEPGAKQTVAVKVAVPTGAAPGGYWLALRVGEAGTLPDEHAQSPAVHFALPALAPKKPLPLWVPLAIGACALALLAGLAAVVWPGQGGLSDAGSADAGPPELPKTIPFSVLCEELRRGGTRAFASAGASCGEPIREEDAVHLSLLDTAFTHESTGRALMGQLSCDPSVDGGLGQKVASWAASIDAGRMSYHGELASQCRRIGRERRLTAGELQETFAPCEGVVQGEVSEGGACASHDECAPSHFCRADAATACGGRCTPRIGLGQACRPRRDLCVSNGGCIGSTAAGFRCELSHAPGAKCAHALECRWGDRCVNALCVERGGAGAACQDFEGNGECKTGFSCRPQPGGGGACTRGADLSEACSFDGRAAPRCGACLFCDAASRICKQVTDVSLACESTTGCPSMYTCGSDRRCRFKPREGEPCILATNQPQQRRGDCLYADNYCRLSEAGATSGVCSALPTLGERCGAGFDVMPQCAEPWACSGGVCVALPGPGQPCVPAAKCAQGSYCDLSTRTCVPAPAPGQACGPSIPCGAGAACVGGRCVARGAPGESCAADAQCLSSVCDPVGQVCLAPCNTPATPKAADGCAKVTNYLLFAVAMGLVRVRRRAGSGPLL